MREIKFRAWDKESNRITQNFIVGSQGSPVTCNNEGGFDNRSDDYILMQYTGLKDKNGNEIYEDDVIRDHFPNPKLWRIKFGSHDTCSGDCESSFAYGWYGQCGEETHELEGLLKYLTDDGVGSEIVGNIYENMEFKDM